MVFELKVYASDHKFYEGACESLTIPMEDGLYGLKAHHYNVICAIIPGMLSFQVPGEKERREAVVSAGLLKFEEGEALILVNTCENPEEIDVKRAQRDRDEMQRLLKYKTNSREYYRAQANLAKAISRIKASRKITR